MEKETLYRYVKCQATPDEELAVLEWLDRDPAHGRLLSEIQRQHDLVALSGPLIDRYHDARGPARRLVRLRRWSAVAAMLALVLFGGYHYLQSRRMTRLSEQMLAIEVPYGQHLKLTLQDGTSVWLNAGSTLRYPALFPKRERRVEIEGEARFEVVRDAQRPFVVETYACDLEVLGTKFNVEADPESRRFSTALFEGCVAVTNRLVAGERVVLSPNRMVTLCGGHLQVGDVVNTDAYRWTEGIINLTGQSFPELMERFEKAFGVTIRLERVPEIHIGQGKIRQSIGIDNALQVLQQFADFRYDKDEQTNTVTIR